MQGISKPQQLCWHTYTIEDLVPEDHIVRKLAAVLDLSFVREATRKLYSKLGRPSIDPVVLVKFPADSDIFFGIRSERADRVAHQDGHGSALVSGAGPCSAPVPDHSTISQLRRRKPAFRKVFRRLFEEVVRQCVEAGTGQRAGRRHGLDSH